MSGDTNIQRKRWLLPAGWWFLLAVQIWFAWDLSELYAGFFPLLLIGPETPFALAGFAIGGVGLIKCFGSGRWLSGIARIAILAMSLWLLFDSPVFSTGTSLYLWRNEESFLARVDAKAAETEGEVLSDFPSSGGVFVEGDPPRYGLEQRWIGMVHWAAFVYDPDKTLKAEKGGEAYIFRYSLMGYERLWGDWYVVYAIK